MPEYPRSSLRKVSINISPKVVGDELELDNK